MLEAASHCFKQALATDPRVPGLLEIVVQLRRQLAFHVRETGLRGQVVQAAGVLDRVVQFFRCPSYFFTSL